MHLNHQKKTVFQNDDNLPTMLLEFFLNFFQSKQWSYLCYGISSLGHYLCTMRVVKILQLRNFPINYNCVKNLEEYTSDVCFLSRTSAVCQRHTTTPKLPLPNGITPAPPQLIDKCTQSSQSYSQVNISILQSQFVLRNNITETITIRMFYHHFALKCLTFLREGRVA